MASKKQRKRKQKDRRRAARPRDNDFLALPTGYIARDGRFIHMRNDATPEEYAEFRGAFLAGKPEVEARLSENRERLLEILASVDPADLVARASLMYLNFDPNTYRESEDDRSPSHVEYLALPALAFGLDSPPSAHPLEFSTLTLEAIDLARSLFTDAAQLLVFGALEANGGEREAITDYQLAARLSSLGVRGTGYAEHLERVILGCFAPLDELCKRVLGFTAQDALAIHAGVAALVESRVNERAVEAPEHHAEMIRELKRARKTGSSDILPSWLLALSPKEAKTHIGAMVVSWIFIDARALAVFTADEVADLTGLPSDVVESF